MATKKTAKSASPQKPAAKKAAAKTATAKADAGLTAEERAAMREYAKERKATAAGANDERAVLEKIAAMPHADRAIAERIHALVLQSAPALTARTWYGMPAYAKDGKVVCFFQDAAKFKARYATLGFSDTAQLDDGEMWPTSFALTKLTPATEKRIAELVKRAAR